jgi:hypothetical protein
MTIIASRNTSVASQQKSQRTRSKHANLAPEQLHQETLDARNTFFNKCGGAEKYAMDVLVPYCEEIIRRYKMQGVAPNDRPNGKPTVDAYFKSINLNYNTVRSWIYRKRLSTEMFRSKQSKIWNKSGKESHLTQLESKLLGTASAGHDLVKAIKNGGNVDAAIRDFEEQAPTPDRIEEYIERPIGAFETEVGKLAIRLCKLIGRNDGKEKKEICALARKLLTKLEPGTGEQLTQPDNMTLPLPQPVDCLEGTAQ